MRSNRQRAKYAMILIGLVILCDIILIIGYLFQIELLPRIESGIGYTLEEAERSDLILMVVGVLYTVVYIISVITFIQWFRRAYYNLHTIEKNLLFTEGWAAGAWFVPILNLFRPYQIMQELYNKTFAILRTNLESFSNKKNSNLVGTWWFAWIVANFIANIDTRVALRANELSELIDSAYLSIASSAIAIPLGFVAIKVIYDYSLMEDELYKLKDIEEGRRIDHLDLDKNGDILDAIDFDG